MPAVAGTLIRPDLIFPRLADGDAAGVLRTLAACVAAAGVLGPGEDGTSLQRALAERERLGSTGLGHGVAIPHCKLRGLEEGIVALGLARPPVEFGAPDGRPVSVFFLVLSPDDRPGEHLQTLARVSRWVRDERHVATLAAMAPDTGREAVYDYLKESL